MARTFMARPIVVRRVAAAALAAAALSLAGRPAAVAGQVPTREYAERRDSLLARVDSGVVVAFGGVEPVVHYPPFSQLPSFEYLTGFHEGDAVLLLVKRGGARTSTLFVPPRNPRLELFVGARTGPAEVPARAGVPGRLLAELRPTVDSLLATGLPLFVVSDVQTADYARADTLTRGARFVAAVRAARPTADVRSLDTVALRLRAQKSPAEVALLRRAAVISAAGHREAMRAVAPGCNEGEIQALLDGTFRRMGGERPGYASIVGSGPNATVLHYDADDRVMQDGDLLVIDAATAFGHYSADVTRTLPVNGRFSPEQRAVYQIVRDAQAAYVRQLRPGASIATASDSGRAVVAAGLARLGLIEAPDATFDAPNTPPGAPGASTAGADTAGGRAAYRQVPQVSLYAWHGYGGHGLGLEVHDPAQYYRGARLVQPGDVFTVEPGVYVKPAVLDGLADTPRNRAMVARLRPVMARYRNVGVRIEDDYAMTAGGVEWLSAGVPREADEVEAAMRARARHPASLPGGGACGRPNA
ncbi:Xaa-Pro aminopeptidase [Gemmatimonadetes bacterium T265]|nr:Xaa-Pro aminopeptidase [Gemmatimonadetes bacterium T265]